MSKKDKKKDVEIIKNVLELVPIRHYDEEVDAFMLSDSKLLDILEIIPKDRKNLQDDELQFEIYALAKFYKLYAPDFKFISLNFPVNTAAQRAVLERVIKRTTDEVRKKWLDREIEELQRLDDNVNRKEFYILYFGRNSDDLLKNRTDILELLGSGRNRLVKTIDKTKKIQILRKICNMNSLILPEDTRGDEDEE